MKVAPLHLEQLVRLDPDLDHCIVTGRAAVFTRMPLTPSAGSFSPSSTPFGRVTLTVLPLGSATCVLAGVDDFFKRHAGHDLGVFALRFQRRCLRTCATASPAKPAPGPAPGLPPGAIAATTEAAEDVVQDVIEATGGAAARAKTLWHACAASSAKIPYKKPEKPSKPLDWKRCLPSASISPRCRTGVRIVLVADYFVGLIDFGKLLLRCRIILVLIRMVLSWPASEKPF